MDQNQSKRPIYLFIICCLLGLCFVLYIMFDSKYVPSTDKTDDILPTNNIINNNITNKKNNNTSPASIPSICTTTIDLLNCIINKSKLRGEQESINEYYQKLISERNIITDTSILEIQCAEQYTYITSLTNTGYQQTILSCSQ